VRGERASQGTVIKQGKDKNRAERGVVKLGNPGEPAGGSCSTKWKGSRTQKDRNRWRNVGVGPKDKQNEKLPRIRTDGGGNSWGKGLATTSYHADEMARKEHLWKRNPNETWFGEGTRAMQSLKAGRIGGDGRKGEESGLLFVDGGETLQDRKKEGTSPSARGTSGREI